jgi:hypothetical protein
MIRLKFFHPFHQGRVEKVDLTLQNLAKGPGTQSITHLEIRSSISQAARRLHNR